MSAVLSEWRMVTLTRGSVLHPRSRDAVAAHVHSPRVSCLGILAPLGETGLHSDVGIEQRIDLVARFLLFDALSRALRIKLSVSPSMYLPTIVT